MILDEDWIVASVRGITMRSEGIGTGNEYVLDPTAMTGWTDGTGVRRSTTAHATSMGDFYEKGTISSRMISFSGTAIANSTAELHQMRDQFIGALADGEYAELEVSTAGGTRYAKVGLEGTPSWVQRLDNVASWKLDLYAPDPRIYGRARSVQLGGTPPATGMSYPIKYPLRYGNKINSDQGYMGNAGNAVAWPKFTARGHMPYGFLIHDNRGRTVRFRGVVTVQSPVTIDMAKGTATQNGIDKTFLIDIREWISIPPQGSINPGFDPIQDGLAPLDGSWCDIIIQDTWI